MLHTPASRRTASELILPDLILLKINFFYIKAQDIVELKQKPSLEKTDRIRSNSHFRYIVSTESGNILIWNRITEQVLFKEEQTNVKQLTLIENSSKFIAISRPNNPTGVENVRTTATLVMRSIPGSKY